MLIRAVLAATLTLWSVNCIASGLEYGFVYRCNAVAVNEALVRECTSSHPELSQQAEAAFRDWTSRYGQTASKAITECEEELREVIETEEERRKVRDFSKEILRKMIKDIQKQAGAVEGQFYSRSLQQLPSERGWFSGSFRTKARS